MAEAVYSRAVKPTPFVPDLGLVAQAEAHAMPGLCMTLEPGIDCAAWHIVTTTPSGENLAAAHLCARRYGIYLPSYVPRATRGIYAGRELRRRPLFPGYVLLFVRDIDAHQSRVRACPGVSGLLMGGERFAVVPDDLVDRIQVIEARLQFARTASVGQKRRWRRERIEDDDRQDEPLGLASWSALRGVEKLDAGQRRARLREALGL